MSVAELSRVQEIAAWEPARRQAFYKSLSDSERARLAWNIKWNWKWRGRPSQQAPVGDWVTWLILAGRGFGKTTSGVQWVRERIRAGYGHTNIIMPTHGDVDKILIDGEAGFIKAIPKEERPRWNGGKNAFQWPNGAQTLVFSAETPERMRGPEHDGLWCDELAAWQYMETWDLAMMGLRLGEHPQCVVTTTPKPLPEIRALVKDPTTIVTRGRTFDNAANLAKPFLNKIIAKYQGTRLGRQEIDGEILDDNPGALWKRSQIDATRIGPSKLPQLVRIAVGVDPGATSKPGSDHTGIVVVGRDGQDPPHFYVLGDYSVNGTPDEWGTAVVKAFDDSSADLVVPEVNQGGEMVTYVLRTKRGSLPVRPVHANRGKRTRAEPVSALYEQGRVHHVGSLPQLEDEMCDWSPESSDDSPDRMDAMVYGMFGCGAVDGMPGFSFSQVEDANPADDWPAWDGFQ